MVCLLGSGNSSTRRPLDSRYSVMPSTEVTFSGAATSSLAGGATGTGFFLPAAWPVEVSKAMEINDADTRRRIPNDIPLLPCCLARRIEAAELYRGLSIAARLQRE